MQRTYAGRIAYATIAFVLASGDGAVEAHERGTDNPATKRRSAMLNSPADIAALVLSFLLPLVGGVWLFSKAGQPLDLALRGALRMTLYAVIPVLLVGVLAGLVRARFDLDIFPIAPLVVLLFLWWVRPFRRPGGGKEAATMSDKQIEKITQAYGEVLEHRAPAPGCFADSSKLPYPKPQIKEALAAALRVTADPKARDLLKFGYLQLANWQPGVGASDVGLDMSRIGSLDPREQARRITAQSIAYDKWAPIVDAEERELEAELRRLELQ